LRARIEPQPGVVAVGRLSFRSAGFAPGKDLRTRTDALVAEDAPLR